MKKITLSSGIDSTLVFRGNKFVDNIEVEMAEHKGTIRSFSVNIKFVKVFEKLTSLKNLLFGVR